jgi:hypothetical protein
MRSRDELRRDTIRLLLSALRNQQIENRAPLEDQQELSVVQREAKRRRENAEEYERVQRPDMADKERSELRIMERYLPQPMDVAEVRAHVLRAVDVTGASTQKEIGRVMAVVLPELKGRADGAVVSQLVRDELREREASA